MVAQAFQPVLTQAKACGYKKYLFECDLVSAWFNPEAAAVGGPSGKHRLPF
jgi:hypothetical protein